MSTENLAEIVAGASKEKIPIGTLLVVDELILPQDLDFALDHQKYTQQPLGEILINIGALKRDDLDKILKLQSGCRS